MFGYDSHIFSINDQWEVILACFFSINPSIGIKVLIPIQLLQREVRLSTKMIRKKFEFIEFIEFVEFIEFIGFVEFVGFIEFMEFF